MYEAIFAAGLKTVLKWRKRGFSFQHFSGGMHIKRR